MNNCLAQISYVQVNSETEGKKKEENIKEIVFSELDNGGSGDQQVEKVKDREDNTISYLLWHNKQPQNLVA